MFTRRAILAVFSVLAASIAILALAPESPVDIALEGFRAKGYPSSREELIAWNDARAASSNCVPIYLAAFERFNFTVEDYGNRPRSGSGFDERNAPLSQRNVEAVEKMIATNSDYLTRLLQASETTQAAFSTDLFPPPWDFMKPQLHSNFCVNAYYAARVMSDAALYHRDRGESGEAVDLVVATYRLGGALSTDIQSTSTLVGHGIDALAADSAQAILSGGQCNEADLRRFEEFLREDEGRRSLEPYFFSVANEYVAVADVLTGNLTEDAMTMWTVLKDRLTPGTQDLEALLTSDDLRIRRIQLATWYLSNLDITFDQVIALENIERLLTASELRFYRGQSGYYLMTGLGPELAILTSFERSIAEIRLARTATIVERHRLQTGSLPVTLAQAIDHLGAEPCIDPFDGKPIRYVRGEGLWYLYSVGRNRIDDGGYNPADDDEVAGDIAFVVQPWY